MTTLLRHPLLHFAALGLFLFLGQSALQAGGILPSARPVLQPDAATIALLRRQAEAHSIDFELLLRAQLDEEILIDQALQRGLDHRDPVARRRLLENMRLSYPDASEAELLRRARAMDMPRRDVLVRRRLIERMEVDIIDRGTQRLAHTEAPMVEQRQAPRLQLVHIFVAGSSIEARQRAEALLAALIRDEVAADEAGEPHLGGRLLRDVALADIRRRLGGAVAEAAARAAPNQWYGPVASAQGWHLLRVTPSQTTVDSDVGWEARAAHYLARERSRHRALAEALANLREDYIIRLPETVAARAP